MSDPYRCECGNNKSPDFDLCYSCSQEKSKELVEVDIDDIIQETDKAYLIGTCNGSQWIPKSQIKDGDFDEGWIAIPFWLAEKKGIA